MATLISGPIGEYKTQDDSGHKEYHLSLLVETDPATEGSNAASQAPGLPVPGSPWDWEDLVDNDVVCHPRVEVRRHKDIKENRPVTHWMLTYLYSSKICDIFASMDPLLQDNKVSGSTTHHTIEATHDRFGVPIQNSAWEQFRGPQVEFDDARPQIIVEQNVADVERELLDGLINGVNDEPMWGLPARCIKFSEYTWSEDCRGPGMVYYKRRLVFDINARINPNAVFGDPDYLLSGWDRDLLDQGQKVLWGHWNSQGKWEVDPIGLEYDEFGEVVGFIYPDRFNPTHFMRAIDRRGNPTTLILNGQGEPWDPDGSTDTSTFWCLSDGVVPTVFEGTCAAAFAQAATLGPAYQVWGPWETNEAATDACSLSGIHGQPFNPSFCPGQGQGSIHVEYYPSVNLFWLNVPVYIAGAVPPPEEP